ncbi:MAG: M16 family metallopeptidase [Candidatus Spyradosoma sp.]
MNDLPARTTLANGVRVFFRRTPPSGLASVQVWVKSGSIHEGELLGGGVSHFLEHMVFKGTEKYSVEELTKTVSAKGGLMNAYTTFTRTVYHIDLPAESAETAFDVLAQMTLFPRLDADDAAREKDVILREIDMCADDPDERISDATRATVFRAHPLRVPIIGRREIFRGIGAEHLRAHFEKRYAPDAISVVVAGDLETEAVFALAEKYFGGVPARAGCAPVVPAEPPQLAPRETTLRGDVNVLRGCAVWRVPGDAHEDAPALRALSVLLGHGDSALLWNELHEKRGLVHELEATRWAPAGEGMFWVGYVADLDKRAAVEAAIEEVVRKVAREGVPAKLLEKTVRQMLVGLVTSRRSVQSTAAALGAEAVENEPGATRVFLEKIRALTPDDLRRVAGRYFHENARTLAAYEAKRPAVAVPAETRSPAAASGYPPFEDVRFANGVRVLLQPVAGYPKVSLVAALRAGGAFEDEKRKGATSLLAELLSLDAGGLSAAEVAERIESVGGLFSTNGGAESLSVALETLTEDFSVARDTLRDALLAPRFTEENFARERDAQLATLRARRDEIEDFAFDAMRERFFGEACPLGTSALGTESALAAMTLADVRALCGRVVAPENLQIAVSGEFDRDAVLSALEEAFGAAAFPSRGGFAAPDFALPTPPNGALEETLDFDGEQTVVQLAFPDVGESDERRFAAHLLAAALNGMSSRLFSEVREKRGLAYYVAASRRTAKACGMFRLYAGTEPKNAAKVLDEMRAEIRRVREGGLTDEEIRDAKITLRVARRSGMQGPLFRATAATTAVLNGLSPNAPLEHEARVEALTREDLARFANEFLRDETSLALTVGRGFAA